MDYKRSEDTTNENLSNDGIIEKGKPGPVTSKPPVFSDTAVTTGGGNAVTTGGGNQYAKNDPKRINLRQLSEMILTQIPNLLHHAKTQYTLRPDQWKRNKAIEIYSD